MSFVLWVGVVHSASAHVGTQQLLPSHLAVEGFCVLFGLQVRPMSLASTPLSLERTFADRMTWFASPTGRDTHCSRGHDSVVSSVKSGLFQRCLVHPNCLEPRQGNGHKSTPEPPKHPANTRCYIPLPPSAFLLPSARTGSSRYSPQAPTESGTRTSPS